MTARTLARTGATCATTELTADRTGVISATTTVTCAETAAICETTFAMGIIETPGATGAIFAVTGATSEAIAAIYALTAAIFVRTEETNVPTGVTSYVTADGAVKFLT